MASKPDTTTRLLSQISQRINDDLHHRKPDERTILVAILTYLNLVIYYPDHYIRNDKIEMSQKASSYFNSVNERFDSRSSSGTSSSLLSSWTQEVVTEINIMWSSTETFVQSKPWKLLSTKSWVPYSEHLHTKINVDLWISMLHRYSPQSWRTLKCSGLHASVRILPLSCGCFEPW